MLKEIKEVINKVKQISTAASKLQVDKVVIKKLDEIVEELVKK